jgi:hypothetical protein
MTPEKLITFISNLTLDQIEQVYVGEANSCTCGCKGNHYLTSEVPSSVKRVLRKVKKECKNRKVPTLEGRAIQLIDNGKVYVLFPTRDVI